MNVLIVDDHHLILLGLKLVISEHYPDAEFDLAGTFKEGLELLEKKAFKLIILDIDVPDGDDVSMIKQIRDIQPQASILMYTGYDEAVYGLAYLSAGADGFLSKSATTDTIADAIRTVLAKKRYLSAAMQEMLISGHSDRENSAALPMTELSPREMRVALLILEGKWTKEIAAILNLQSNTISTYKKRIFTKLGITSSAQLAKKLSPKK